MNIIKLIKISIISIFLLHLTVSVATGNANLSKKNIEYARSIFKQIEKGNWQNAIRKSKKINNKMLEQLVYWLYLNKKTNNANFNDYQNFIKQNPNLPKINRLKHFAEYKINIKSKKKIKHSWIYDISKKINLTPSLYLEAGAVHGCAIIHNNNPLIYMEDVGRHNAVDKIAGYMFMKNIKPTNKIFYTTGRLTSEMVIKTVKMGIPILLSRSGFTSWGVELAQETNLTLIGRAKGKKYIVLSGEHRIDH